MANLLGTVSSGPQVGSVSSTHRHPSRSAPAIFYRLMRSLRWYAVSVGVLYAVYLVLRMERRRRELSGLSWPRWLSWIPAMALGETTRSTVEEERSSSSPSSVHDASPSSSSSSSAAAAASVVVAAVPVTLAPACSAAASSCDPSDKEERSQRDRKVGGPANTAEKTDGVSSSSVDEDSNEAESPSVDLHSNRPNNNNKKAIHHSRRKRQRNRRRRRKGRSPITDDDDESDDVVGNNQHDGDGSEDDDGDDCGVTTKTSVFAVFSSQTSDHHSGSRSRNNKKNIQRNERASKAATRLPSNNSSESSSSSSLDKKDRTHAKRSPLSGSTKRQAEGGTHDDDDDAVVAGGVGGGGGDDDDVVVEGVLDDGEDEVGEEGDDDEDDDGAASEASCEDAIAEHEQDLPVEDETLPLFVLLIGLPGSGKSTWSKSFLSRSKAQFAVICSDDVRKQVTGDINNQTQNDSVWAEVAAAVHRLLVIGTNTILDATNLDTIRRRTFVKTLPPCRMRVKIFHISKAQARSRISRDLNEGKERSAVPDKVIHSMHKKFHETMHTLPDEGWRSFSEDSFV